jgi:hypothetical protein
MLILIKSQIAMVPKLISGHRRANGALVQPHISRRRVGHAPPPPEPKPQLDLFESEPTPKLNARKPILDEWVAKHGGYARIRDALIGFDAEGRAKLVDLMAQVGGVPVAEVLKEVGLIENDIKLPDPKADQVEKPLDEAVEPGPPAVVAAAHEQSPLDQPVTSQPSDPVVEDAEDREDLAAEMAKNPHSRETKSLLSRFADRLTGRSAA